MHPEDDLAKKLAEETCGGSGAASLLAGGWWSGTPEYWKSEIRPTCNALLYSFHLWKRQVLTREYANPNLYPHLRIFPVVVPWLDSNDPSGICLLRGDSISPLPHIYLFKESVVAYSSILTEARLEETKHSMVPRTGLAYYLRHWLHIYVTWLICHVVYYIRHKLSLLSLNGVCKAIYIAV